MFELNIELKFVSWWSISVIAASSQHLQLARVLSTRKIHYKLSRSIFSICTTAVSCMYILNGTLVPMEVWLQFSYFSKNVFAPSHIRFWKHIWSFCPSITDFFGKLSVLLLSRRLNDAPQKRSTTFHIISLCHSFESRGVCWTLYFWLFISAR